jgi:hypothetical protein
MGTESRGESHTPPEPPRRSVINKDELEISLDLDGRYVLKKGTRTDVGILRKGADAAMLKGYKLTSDVPVDVDGTENNVGIFNPTSDDRQRYRAQLAEAEGDKDREAKTQREEIQAASGRVGEEDKLLAARFFDREHLARDIVDPDADSLKKIYLWTDLTDSQGEKD